MSLAADLVENHAGNVDFGIKRLIAQDEWGNAAGHALHIYDQNHGRMGESCQRGITVAALNVESVIQALVTLNKGYIGCGGVVAQSGEDFVPLHGVEIKIITGAISRPSKPHGIDIIRTFLVGLDDVPLIRQRFAQPDTESGFAGGLVCCRNQQTLHGRKQRRDVIDRALLTESVW